MEFLIELVMELVIDGSKNKKTPKFLRYTLLILTVLFFLCVIGGIMLVGIRALGENHILSGLILILIGFILVSATVTKVRKILENNKA